MNRDDVNWQGYWAACPTPFDVNGEIVEESFRRLLNYYLEEGAHGVLINGSTGEWFSQSESERQRVAEIAVSEIHGRVPIVVGCTAFTPRSVSGLAENVLRAGADGAMLTPPPYVRPTPDDIVAFVEAVSGASSIPLMVYNIPRRVSIGIDVETVTRLARITNVVALKNAVEDEEFYPMLEAVAADLRVFGGNFLSKRGVTSLQSHIGDGYIGGWQLLGSKLPNFFRAVWAGDNELALNLAAEERALDRALWDTKNNPLFGRSFQSQMKAALNIMGLPAGYTRPPLLPLTDERQLTLLRSVLIGAGVPVPADVRAS